jgi:hypothetical protein
MDKLLSSARDSIKKNGMSQFPIPNIDLSFSKEVSFTLNVLNVCNYVGKYYIAVTIFLVFPFQIWPVTWHGSFRTAGGKVGYLDTITRTGDISIDYENGGTFKVFGSVGLSSLKVRNMSA